MPETSGNGSTQPSLGRAEKRVQRRKREAMIAGACTVFLVAVSVVVATFYGLIPINNGGSHGRDPGLGSLVPEEDPCVTAMAPLERALQVRGVYLTMDTAGTPSRMGSIIRFVRNSPGLNGLVIDLKDNSGKVPCKPPDNIISPAAGYGHFPGIVSALKQEGYFTIARIVAFQDPYMAQAVPEQAIRRSDGSLWRDRDGRLWLNPYDKRNWEYMKGLALWALDMGFDEIQLDYVRFPDSARNLETSGVIMPGWDDFESRGEAIVAFLEYMGQAVEGKAYLSADIFGFTTIATDDMGIGQKLEDVASAVDFICPMVYPSHYYNAGIYGFEVPEAHPYEVVCMAMEEAKERTSGLKAQIRPWLQDFSYRIKYGPDEVQGQIQATFESGLNTFILWNPANVYTKGVTYAPPQ